MATTQPVTFSSSLPNTRTKPLNTPDRSQYDASTLKSLGYRSMVVCSDLNIIVDAWLPDTVGIDINATYDAPFAQGLTDSFGKIGALAKFAGLSLTTQALTAQVWQAGSFIDFRLPFVFQADTSTVKDVMTPIKNLMRLAMPKDPEVGGLLKAPGPHIDFKKLAQNAGSQLDSGIRNLTDGRALGYMVDTGRQLIDQPTNTLSTVRNTADNVARPFSQAIVNSVVNNISLYVGQFLYLASVVVTDVSPTFDIVIGKDGNPMRASVDVSFRTFYIPTENDIQTMFSATPIQN